MPKSEERNVWVFCGDGSQLPSGVFSARSVAEAWICRHKLTGLLTAYPVDSGVYDWAVDRGYFNPNDAAQRSAKFIGRFTSARLEHVHFEDGEPVA